MPDENNIVNSELEDYARASLVKDKKLSIKRLKDIVMTIDWEITDKTMDSYEYEIQVLKKVYEKDRLLTLHLNMLDRLGLYIKIKKAKVHPDSIEVLHTALNSLEKIVNSGGIDEGEKKRILALHTPVYRNFRKSFKKRISQRVPPAKCISYVEYSNVKIRNARKIP